MKLECGTAVGWVRTMNRSQDTKVVNVLSDTGKQIAHRQTTLTVLLKFPRGLEEIFRFCEQNFWQFKWGWFPAIPSQHWLRIERVDLRWATFHEQKNDSLGARWKVG